MESLWEGLARRPGDPVMFARLREQLEDAGDFVGLTRLYRQRADAVGGEEALHLYLSIAEVWASRLGDQEAVAMAYEKALNLSEGLGEEGPAQVRDSLKEVFWARGDWRSLADLTEAEARQMSPGIERARHWMDLAQLRLAKLSEVDQALAAFIHASEEPSAPIHEIRQSLHSLLERHPEHHGIFDALREVSEAHLTTSDDARQLLELLSMRYERLDENQDQVPRRDLLIQMGRLAAEHLDDGEVGIGYLKQAHEAGAEAEALAPVLEGMLGRGEHPELLTLLRALYRVMGRWESFVETGKREASRISAPEERAAVLMEVAIIQEEHLGGLDEASMLYGEAATLDVEISDTVVERLQGILTREPTHAGALSALGQIHRARGDDEALLELLEAEEARERSEDRRAGILVQMAEICAGTYGRPDRALEYYEAAADLAGEGVEPIIEGLFGLYHQGYYADRVERVLRALCTRTERWASLVMLLELLLDDARDQARQAELHHELGDVLENKLDELEKAMHHYQRAFRLDTTHQFYIDAGRALYRKMGNLEMVARLYDIQLKVSTGPEVAARLLLDKSKVLAEEIRDPARALEALGRACAVAPEMEEAHEAMEALARGPYGVAAMATLETAYLGAGRPAEAAAIYLMVADRMRHVLERIPTDAAERPAALNLANDCDLRAYDLDPTGNARVRATNRLEQGLAEAGRWTELAELLERRASRETDHDTRVELLLRLGGIAWDKLKAVDLASAAWETVLDLEPGQLRAYTSLEGMYQEAEDEGRRDELICWALDKAPWANADEAPKRRSDLFVRLAKLRMARGADADAYRAWLLLGELDANHPEARDYFESRADTPEGAQDLFRLMERGLIELTDVHARAERLVLLASLASERMRDPLLSIDQHQAIMELVGVENALRQVSVAKLRELYRDIEQLDALVDLLEVELGREETGEEERVELLGELVSLHETERHDLDAARATLLRLIEKRPEAPEHRLHLARLCHRQGAIEREAEVLREMLALSEAEGGWDRVSDGESKALRPDDLRLRLARLEADDLGALDLAVATYRPLVGHDVHGEVALDELQRVLVRQRDFEGLMALLGEQVETARDTSDKIHFIGRMAMLAEHELGDATRAISLWRRVLDLRAKDPDALQTLEQLYNQTRQRAEIIEVCKTRLTISTEPELRARLQRKIGRLHRQDERFEEARDTYLALIEEFPDDVLARQALYEIYRVQEDYPALMGMIEDLLRYESEPTRRHDLMAEQARVALDHQEDIGVAISVLEKLVEEHPQDAASMERLYELLTGRENWFRASQVLAQLAGLAPDSARKIDLLLKLASIHKDELRSPEHAAEVLEQVLELHPANREALLRLEQLYENLERAEALVRIRSRLFDLATDPIEQISLLQSLSKVLEKDLGKAPAAFDKMVLAHELDPDDTEHLAELYRLAEAAGLWPRLLEVLTADAARASSLDARHQIQVKMAELVEQHLDDRPGAFAIYRTIFLDAPQRGPVLDELERLAGLDGALWTEVIALYSRLLTLTANQEALAQYHWKIAELQQHGLSDPEAAFETYRKALSLESGTDESLAKLRSLAEEAGLWSALVSVGEARWPALESGAEQIEVLLDNAQLIETHIKDAERALEQYVLAFQIDPRHEEVETRLRGLAKADDSVKTLMLKLYEKVIKDHRSEDEPEGQIHFLRRITSLHEAREEPEEAFTATMRAFKVDPHIEDVHAEMERLGAQIGRLGEVAEAYQGEAEQSRRDEAMIFFLAAGRLLSGPLGFPDQAIELLRSALEIHPDNTEVLAQLETLYRDKNDLESLVGLYIHRAERTVDRVRRYEAYLAVAELLEQSTDPERSVEYYRRALRLNPRNVEVLERLSSLYERLEQPDRMARCLEQIVEIVEDEDEPKLVEVLDRLAQLYASNRRPSRAVEVQRRLLTLRPLRQDFFARLEEELERSNKIDALMAQYEERVNTLDGLIVEIENLEGEPPARLKDTEGQTPTIGPLRMEQLRILRTMVDMATEALKNPRRAVKVLGEMLGRFPDDIEAIERLAELYARLERWQDHIDTLRRRMDFSTGASGRAMVLRQIAEVYEERLYHPDKAAGALAELIEQTPDDGTTLIDLGRLYTRLEKWEEATVAYEQAVTLDESAALPEDIQAEIWCRLADIHEKFTRDEDAAFSAYEAALKLHPDNPQARQAVIRYLAGGVQWERQISLLRIEVNQTSSREKRAQLLWQIGTIYRDRGEDPMSAQEALEAALEEDGDLLAVLRDLADVVWQASLWEKAVEVYNELLGGNFTRVALEKELMPTHRLVGFESREDPAYVIYMVRLGWSFEQLGRTKEGVECYTQALRIRSSNTMALLGAGRHAFNNNDRDVALRHLNKLMTVHRDELDSETFADVTYMLGSIHHANGQHDKSLSYLSQSLERQPDHRVAAQLSFNIATQLHREDQAAESLSRIIGMTEDPDERRGLLVQLGDLCIDRLDDPERALEAYSQVLEEKPDDKLAAERRLEILIRLSKWDEAMEASGALVAVDEARLAEDPSLGEQRIWVRGFVGHLLRHGHVLLDGHDKGDEALAVYERAMEVDPTNLDPLVQIGLVLGQRGDFEALTERYDHFIGALPKDGIATRIEVLRRLGGLLKESLGAYERALEVFLELQRLAPKDIRVHDALSELYLTESLRDPEAALSALRTLVRLDDISETRLRQILSLYRDTGRHDGAGQLLRLLDFCRCTSKEEQQLVRDLSRDDLGELRTGDLQGKVYEQSVLPEMARGPLAAVLTFVFQKARGALYQSLQEVGADESDRISDRRNLNVASIFRDVADIVGMNEVELYLRREGVKGVRVMLTRPPSIVIGEDVFRGLFNREQRFVLGRALELSRPAFIAAAAMPAFEFLALFEALFVMGSVDPARAAVADERLAEGIERWLGTLEEVLEEDDQFTLMELVESCEEAFGGRRPTALEWRHTAQASAQRVGLFLSGDPLVALKRLLREEERLRSPSIRSIEDLSLAMETSRDVREIVLYLLSEDFISARRSLRGEAFPEKPLPEPEVEEAIVELDIEDAELVEELVEDDVVIEPEEDASGEVVEASPVEPLEVEPEEDASESGEAPELIESPEEVEEVEALEEVSEEVEEPEGAASADGAEGQDDLTEVGPEEDASEGGEAPELIELPEEAEEAEVFDEAHAPESVDAVEVSIEDVVEVQEVEAPSMKVEVLNDLSLSGDEHSISMAEEITSEDIESSISVSEGEDADVPLESEAEVGDVEAPLDEAASREVPPAPPATPEAPIIDFDLPDDDESDDMSLDIEVEGPVSTEVISFDGFDEHNGGSAGEEVDLSPSSADSIIEYFDPDEMEDEAEEGEGASGEEGEPVIEYFDPEEDEDAGEEKD